MWSIGVGDTATQNQPFVALVASVVPFQANPSQFFAVFDSLVAITTHSGAQNLRSGRFRVNDDDADNRRTKRLLYPLLRMRARGKNTEQQYKYCVFPLSLNACLREHAHSLSGSYRKFESWLLACRLNQEEQKRTTLIRLRWRVVWQRIAMELSYREIAERLCISVGTAYNTSYFKQLEVWMQSHQVSDQTSVS